MTPERPRILELHEQIRASAGRAAEVRWHTLKRSYDVWLGNREELRSLLVAARDDPNVAIHAASNVPSNQVAARLRQEFDRRLHNYVAGFVSLIDHSRRFIEHHYPATPLEVEYNQRRKVFTDDPTACFVRELRNYVLHREAPPYKVTTHLGNRPTPTAHFSFPAQQLLEWDKWTAPARSFLQGLADGEVDVLGVVDRHAVMVYELWGWLFSQHPLVDAEVLAEYTAMMTEYHSLRSPPRTGMS